MSQLKVYQLDLNSVPKELNHEFLKATFEAYYEYATNPKLPEVGWITHDVLDEHALEIASLLDTNDENKTFHFNEMNALPDNEQSCYFYQLRDQLFDPSFDDVIHVLRTFRLSYCLMEGTTSGIYHNLVEVW